MDPTLVSIASIIAVVLLLLLGVPLGYGFAIVGFAGIWVLRGLGPSLSVIGFMPYNTVGSFTLSVVPLFILLGYLAMHAGASTGLFRAAYKWFGRLPGGLGVALVFGCAGFGAVCGSTLATAIAMGKVAIPEMRKYGYDKSFACACAAAGGTLGVLIPPSIPAVIYCSLTGTSVGKVLIAGILPGILGAIAYSSVIIVWSRRKAGLAPSAETFSWKERFTSLKGVYGILIVAATIIATIYTGVATPTEAGALGAFVTFCLFLISGNFSRSGLVGSLVETGQTTRSLFIILTGAFIYSRFLAIAGLPMKLSSWIVASGFPPLLLLAAVIALFVLLGMFIDPISMQVLAVPLVFPAITAAGFDPIWFGIIVIRMVEIATLTPPVGFNVYAMGSVIPDVDIGSIFRYIVPFILVDLLTLIVLTAFPIIVLIIPNMMK